MNSFKLSGTAISLGGLLLIMVNAVFTPMLDMDVPFTEMMASQTYLWRLTLASLTVFLLMIGSSGLYRYQAEHSGLFAKFAFALTFVGCAALFAHEWGQVFFIHSMAVAAPDALQAMEDAEGMNAFDLEAMIAIIGFTFGWLAFAVSMLMAKDFPRPGPVLIIAGFFAVPLLSVATTPVIGGALGNAVLGTGFILLGRELVRGKQSASL